MNEIEKLEFVLEISSADASEDELDDLTRRYLHELNQTDVDSARLVQGGPVPSGAKGDPVTVGSIAIAVLPALLPKIVETIQGWLLRGNNRTVKFKGVVNGQSVDFEGTAEDLQKLLQALTKGKKKK